MGNLMYRIQYLMTPRLIFYQFGKLLFFFNDTKIKFLSIQKVAFLAHSNFDNRSFWSKVLP